MISPAEVAKWQERVEAWEAEVIDDARLTGSLPVADYADRPFQVPPEVEAALRDLRDPAARERRLRAADQARREARKRRSLAAMLREKGDEGGAATQEAVAGGFDAEADAAEELASLARSC